MYLTTESLQLLSDFIIATKALEKAQVPMSYLTIDDVACAAPCCPPKYNPFGQKASKRNMEDTMNNQTYTTIQADATDKNVTAGKEYLQSRIRQEKCRKASEIEKLFHIEDDASPKSAKETLDRIAKGMYVLPPKYLAQSEENDEDDFCCFSPTEIMYAIRWRNPAVPADKVGAKAARAALETAYTKAYDTVTVLDAEKGLAALTEFQGYVVNAPTTTTVQ